MSLNALKTAAVIAAVVVGVGAGPVAARASAAAQDKKKPAPADKANQVEGVLKAVDVTRNAIRVLSGTKDPKNGLKSEEDRTIAVAPDATITLAAEGKGGAKAPPKAVKLADLKEGMRVIVRLSEDRKTVTDVKAAPRENAVTGQVRSADAVKNTVTIGTKDKATGANGEQTYAVAADATVSIAGHGKESGRTGKLADIKQGMSVTLRLTEDGKSVVAVRVAAPTAQGVVKSVDAVKGTLVITVGAKNTANDVTYEVKAAPIRIGGKEAKLADLKPETRVQIQLSPGDGSVVGVMAGEKGKVK